MKLQQLEYVIEIAREGSISGAARKLYQAQPNISMALKELENEIGIQIFWRTGSGMTLTPEGEEFFGRARKIITDFRSLVSDYSVGAEGTVTFRLEASHSSYITTAVGVWINKLSSAGKSYNMHFTETNTGRVIDDTGSERCDIGVIRVPANQSRLYEEKLESKGLTGQVLTEFPMQVMMKRGHFLEDCEDIPYEKLRECTEIVHGDEDLNIFRKTYINPDFDTDYAGKAVFVYDRGSKISMLNSITDAYMWVAPMPKSDLLHSNMVLRKCSYACVPIRDIIIYSSTNKKSPLIKSCIASLVEYTSSVMSEN